MRYDDVNVSTPRTAKIATIAPAKRIGGVLGALAPKPPSSSGLISAGNKGSVAAAATMPSTASAKVLA